MSKLDLHNIQELIHRACVLDRSYLDATRGTVNPQIHLMRAEREGELQAYLSVLDALGGDSVMLKIAANGK